MAKILKPLTKKGTSNVVTTPAKGSKPTAKPSNAKSTPVKAPVKPIASKVTPVKLPAKLASQTAAKPAAKGITKPAAKVLPIKSNPVEPAAKSVPVDTTSDIPRLLTIKVTKTPEGKISGIYKHSQTGNFQMRYPELGCHIATLATEELAIEHQRKLINLVKKYYEEQRHLFDSDVEYIKAIYTKYLRIKRVAAPKVETTKPETKTAQVKKLPAPVVKGKAIKPPLKPLTKTPLKPLGKKPKNTHNDL